MTKGHIARAALESTAWQVRDVVTAMALESGVDIAVLKVDGGMTASDLLMDFQADVLDVPVVRPTVAETTCLGAAYAAGLDRRLLAGPGRAARPVEGRPPWTAQTWPPRPATTAPACGRRPSPAAWTGSKTCDGPLNDVLPWSPSGDHGRTPFRRRN